MIAAREWDYYNGFGYVGIAFHTRQYALGPRLFWARGDRLPSVEFYLGPLEFYAGKWSKGKPEVPWEPS